MSLYISLTYLIGPKSQKLTEISRFENVAESCFTKSTITRSIFKIEGSSLGCSLILMGFKNHVLQLKLSEQFFNDPGGIGFKIFGFSKNNSLAKQSMVLTNPYFQEQLFCVL